MDGTGVPIVTPFDADGDVREAALRGVARWLVERGADFLVPCGSTGEAPLLSVTERTRVVEVVSEAVDCPVLAGTGHPGRRETIRQTRADASAGADAALVVTPFYYAHDDAALVAYYRTVADQSPIPVYLYSVPKFTGVTLAPSTVETLATHDNVAGIKDSSGNLELHQRYLGVTEDAEFSVLAGSGGLYASALGAGADGGVLALANAVPERAAEVYRLAAAGKTDQAAALNADLVELNRALTTHHGIPGVKAALAARDQPAGLPRAPLRPVGEDVRANIATLVEDALV